MVFFKVNANIVNYLSLPYSHFLNVSISLPESAGQYVALIAALGAKTQNYMKIGCEMSRRILIFVCTLKP